MITADEARKIKPIDPDEDEVNEILSRVEKVIKRAALEGKKYAVFKVQLSISIEDKVYERLRKQGFRVSKKQMGSPSYMAPLVTIIEW